MTGEDAIEFMMAGAKCISIGSANLVNPNASIEVINGIEEFMRKHNIEDINSIIDTVEMN